MPPKAPKLVVGVGNILQSDDGVGVRAVQLMAGLSLPNDIEVFDAGTSGLDTAPVLENRELVIVIDAIDAGTEPGKIYRMTPEQLSSQTGESISLHQANILDALAETKLLGNAPKQVIFYVVQIEDVSMGVKLTPPVERSLKKVLTLVLKELDLPADIIKHIDANASAQVSY
jgi:hydrogenase maturation protease